MSDRLFETSTFEFVSQISRETRKKAKVYLENTYQECSHIVCVNKVRQYKEMQYAVNDLYAICVSKNTYCRNDDTRKNKLYSWLSANYFLGRSLAVISALNGVKFTTQ